MGIVDRETAQNPEAAKHEIISMIERLAGGSGILKPFDEDITPKGVQRLAADVNERVDLTKLAAALHFNEDIDPKRKAEILANAIEKCG